jgi:hypothetical protein
MTAIAERCDKIYRNKIIENQALVLLSLSNAIWLVTFLSFSKWCMSFYSEGNRG